MARLFDGRVNVGYHSATLVTTETDGQGLLPEDCFPGQANGLCGAVIPGALMFTTGLHTGEVGFTVDVLDSAPPLDGTWEEIVEVSFVNQDGEVTLCDFDGPNFHKLPLSPGTYRVRYGDRGGTRGNEVDTSVDETPVEFCSLVFWPAPAAPDAVLKQTGQWAAYWHQAYKGKAG